MPQIPDLPVERKASYSIRSLFFATSLIAWILGVNSWLSSPYGWLTAIPLTLGLPIFILRPWSFVGGLVGFVLFALLGEFALIGWDKSAPEYLQCLVTIGAYGLTCGSSVHAFFLRLRLLSCLVCVAALAVFVISLLY